MPRKSVFDSRSRDSNNTTHRLRSEGVHIHRCFAELLMDLSLLVGGTKSQQCCYDKMVLFLIYIDVLWSKDIFSTALFVLFYCSLEKAASSAILFSFIPARKGIYVNSKVYAYNFLALDVFRYQA